MDISSFREARERAGYSPQDMAQILEVRPEYVEALERGELHSFVGPSYVRSILVRYAVCVELDPEQVLKMPLATASASSAIEHEYEADSWVVYPEAPGHARRLVSKRRIIIAAAAAGLLVAAALGALQVMSIFPRGDERAIATAQTTAQPAGTTSTTSAPVTTVAPVATTVRVTTPASVAMVPAAAHTVKYTVLFSASAEVWLEVTSEKSGRVLYSGSKAAGEDLRLVLTRPIRAVVGKPEAVSLTVDGVEAVTPHTQVWRVSAAGVEAVR